jgi:predicted SAM-dependent methyltransferase
MGAPPLLATLPAAAATATTCAAALPPLRSCVDVLREGGVLRMAAKVAAQLLLLYTIERHARRKYLAVHPAQQLRRM